MSNMKTGEGGGNRFRLRATFGDEGRLFVCVLYSVKKESVAWTGIPQLVFRIPSYKCCCRHFCFYSLLSSWLAFYYVNVDVRLVLS